MCTTPMMFRQSKGNLMRRPAYTGHADSRSGHEAFRPRDAAGPVLRGDDQGPSRGGGGRLASRGTGANGDRQDGKRDRKGRLLEDGHTENRSYGRHTSRFLLFEATRAIQPYQFRSRALRVPRNRAPASAPIWVLRLKLPSNRSHLCTSLWQRRVRLQAREHR